MKFSEFYEVLDALAPKRLSDEYCEKYGAYDNSGVLVGTGKEVKTALFSLDFSENAVQKAKELGADVIVTHHPAIYAKIGSISAEEGLGRKLTECIQNGISVVSMHLNLDLATFGVDDMLVEAVCKACGGKVGEVAVMHTVEGGGYGKAYSLPSPVSSDELVAGLKLQLKAVNLSVFGKSKKLTRAASFCGGGASEEAIAFAKEQGAEVIVSADFKHHLVLDALERGLVVIAPTHYATENYGFKKYYQKISRSLPSLSCVYHEEKSLL